MGTGMLVGNFTVERYAGGDFCWGQVCWWGLLLGTGMLVGTLTGDRYAGGDF